MSSSFSVHSPPFTPVRSKALTGNASATMLMTPGETPIAASNKSKNRFAALASPVTPQRNVSRNPLSPKSQNIAPTEVNWRVKRKPLTPNAPPKSITHGKQSCYFLDPDLSRISHMLLELLPSPFHSTQRRSKVNQNKNATSGPVVCHLVSLFAVRS